MSSEKGFRDLESMEYLSRPMVARDRFYSLPLLAGVMMIGLFCFVVKFPNKVNEFVAIVNTFDGEEGMTLCS